MSNRIALFMLVAAASFGGCDEAQAAGPATIATRVVAAASLAADSEFDLSTPAGVLQESIDCCGQV